jgi:putative flippase GtrA/pimeloyl-ACP methyl ester carboxylesterase
MRSHTAALIVMASTARIPVLTPLVTLLTDEPRVESATVGGVCCTLVRPQRKEARGTIVFLNGGTRLGCNHPAVQRLVRGMGRIGCLVVAPELPGLKDGELTPATLEAAIEAAAAAAATAPTGRIVLFGVSAGASLGLLAAADPSLDGRVSTVVAIAPWAELDSIVRMATTGFYDEAPRETTPLVQHFVASSLKAAVRPGRDGRAVDELLANRDPQRFDALRVALPMETDAVLEQFSPLHASDRLDVPVELVSAADDGYFPLAEAEKLAAALPHARLTVTSLLDHVRLRPAVRVRELVRFSRFAARSFAAAVAATKKQHRAAQPLRFLTVGAGGYAVSLLAFAALYAAGTPYAIAAGAAYLLSNALMYIGNRYFTFRLGHDGFWTAYARYLSVGLLVAGLNASLLTALVEGAGVDPRIGQAVALLLVTPPAFLLFKRWTFKLQSA